MKEGERWSQRPVYPICCRAEKNDVLGMVHTSAVLRYMINWPRLTLRSDDAQRWGSTSAPIAGLCFQNPAAGLGSFNEKNLLFFAGFIGFAKVAEKALKAGTGELCSYAGFAIIKTEFETFEEPYEIPEFYL